MTDEIQQVISVFCEDIKPGGITITHPSREKDKSSDLAKWQRKALKRIEQGKPAACSFESDTIPAPLAAAISGQLEGAQTKEDVQSVFSSQWMGYP